MSSEYLYCFPLNTNSILKLHMLSAPTNYFMEKRAYVFILSINYWIQDTIAYDKLPDLILGMKSKNIELLIFWYYKLY